VSPAELLEKAFPLLTNFTSSSHSREDDFCEDMSLFRTPCLPFDMAGFDEAVSSKLASYTASSSNYAS